MRASALILAVAPLAVAPLAVAAAQAPDTLGTPQNLVVEEVPPIPGALPGEVQRYTESRSAFYVDWHPTKREMLIATRFGNVSQVHSLRSPLGARTQVTFFQEPVTSASYEPRKAAFFVFARDVGGDEFAQLYRYDLADGATTLLTDGGRSQNGAVRWSTIGDRIAYASTRRNGADRDIWLMNPADPKIDRILHQVSGGGWSPLDWSSDDRRLLVLEYLSVNRSRLWVVDVATGGRTQATPETERDTVSYGGAEFTPDGRNVYLTTDAGSEFKRLARLDLASKRITPLSGDIPWDVESFDMAPDGRTVAFETNEAGISRLYLLDVGSGRVRPVTGIPTGVIAGLEWHRTGRYLAFSLSFARSAYDVYVLDSTSGAVTRWTESELGGIVAERLAEPTLIRWPSFDRREITGLYYRPPTRFTGKRPVVVSIHGGPESQARPGFLGRSNYYLNELGAALILPNVRGSRGYGKSFVKLDNGMKREESVRDIGALLDWIAKQPELDAGRVMVTGGSYGGYMTLAVATNYADRICCALDVVGISNFVTFLENTESYRRDLRRAEYGDEREPEMRAFMERIAPVNNARKITRPLFVVQGANDPRVPRSEAEQMVAKVRENGGPVWYLLAQDEGHGFQKKGNADYLFYSTVLFMRRFLIGQAEQTSLP